MNLTIQISRETDGRWIAEVVELPGVLVYGDTRVDAVRGAKALALEVLAEEVRNGERELTAPISFVEPKAA